jgi:glutamate racemase
MLKTIAARAAQPKLTYHGNCLAAKLHNSRFSIRARGTPSAFTDWRELRSAVPHRTYWRSTFVSSTPAVGSSDSANEQVSITLHDNELRRIEEKKEIFPPPDFDRKAVKEKYKHKKLAVKLVEDFKKIMAAPESHELHAASTLSLSDHLLPSVDVLANAATVMIFCGSNTTEGKLTADNAVSAAIAAYALHLCYKTPIIVCDEPNRRLIEKLLTNEHPELGPYLRYLPIKEVNGQLVRRLYKEFNRHAPDLSLYIGIPGRNRDGDYLDQNGSSISLLNVALDQALNMQNLMKIPSIAICHSDGNAGFPECSLPGNQEDDAAVIRATYPLVVSDLLQGTLGLMELLCNACLDSQAYQPKLLATALDTATMLTENGDFKAPTPRSGVLQQSTWVPKKHEKITESHATVQRLSDFQKLTASRRITWTESIEKSKLEGPKVRHAVLYDSSDGVLIAANDFIRYIRARSNFVLKVDAVADHAKASYGKHSYERLFEIVVDGVAFSAKLKADVIVMVCNTACTVDLDSVKEAVTKWLEGHGIRGYQVHIIDLVKTVAAAVIELGGSKPTLLATEATSESGAYPRVINEAAERAGTDLPEITVIGCGNRNARPNKDLAHLVNKLAHLKDKTSIAYTELEREVERYVDLIPLDSTSVWLCCTHFPALLELFRKHLNRRLEDAGLPEDSIPIMDPLVAQAEATIRFLEEQEQVENKDYRAIQDLRVLTTGIKEEVAASTRIHIGKEGVPLFTVNFPNVTILPAPSPRARPAPKDDRRES